MKTLYAIVLVASCTALADTADIKRRYSDRAMALRRPDTLTAEMVAEMAIVKPEPEIQIITTREQFIAHLESKLVEYKSLLQRVEQTQANDREGTEEKFKAERAKGGPQYDGPPPYFRYEKDKAKLRKKIQNTENKLKILKSCPNSKTKTVRAVPAAFYDDFLMACSNFDIAVSYIPVSKQDEELDMDTRRLRMAAQDFERLEAEHRRLNKSLYAWSNPEDEALHTFFEEVKNLLRGVIYLVGPFRIRAIKNIKAIDADAKKALESNEPGIVLMKMLRDKISVVARFNGRYARMLNEATMIIDRHLTMCFY